MSDRISPQTKLKYGIEMTCKVWKFSRSTFYHSRKRILEPKDKRGRLPSISDDDLIQEIKEDIKNSHFHGEGHKKIHARLRRFRGIKVGRNRILNLMRRHKMLSPYRYKKRDAKLHDGRITTDDPNIMWGTDAAKVYTLEDGWIWFFGVIEHWNGECLGWHVAKKGNRFAAIESLTQAIEKVFKDNSNGICRGLKLRIDHGSQFLSDGFINQARYWGISISKGFVREPETNGVIERFHRTFKEQIVHGRQYHSVEDFRRAVGEFISNYNEKWLLEKLGYHSPIEARKKYLEGENVLTKGKISSGLAEVEREHGYFVLATKKDVT